MANQIVIWDGEKYEAVVDELCLRVSATFIPHSQSWNADRHPLLNWRIVLLKRIFSGPQINILAADYSAGAIHCPSYGGAHADRWKRVGWECEHGFAYGAHGDETKKIHPPNARDVAKGLTLLEIAKLRLILSITRSYRALHSKRA